MSRSKCLNGCQNLQRRQLAVACDSCTGIQLDPSCGWRPKSLQSSILWTSHRGSRHHYFRPSAAQVETELREVDAKFSRLHGVPAGRALDLYGRVIGGPATQTPEAAPAARKQGSRSRGHASTLKCVAI